MTFALLTILEAAMIASALSIDSFTAGLAYGSNKIKLPFRSVMIINVVCSSILGIALFAGAFISSYLPHWLTVTVSFTILVIIGIIKLLDSITKSIIRKHSNISKKFTLSILNFNFILNLYANPEKADLDQSNSLSPYEAVLLAISLSFDGIAIGLGAGIIQVNVLAVILWSLITDALFLMCGHVVGTKIAQKLPFNISWISGIVLIGLAFSKIL